MSTSDKEIKERLDAKNKNLTAAQEIAFNSRHLPKHERLELMKEQLRKVKASNMENPKEEEEINFERKERQRAIWGGAVAVTFFYLFFMSWFNPHPPEISVNWGSFSHFWFSVFATLVTCVVAGIIALISRLFIRSWGIVFAVVIGILLSLDLITRILKFVGYWDESSSLTPGSFEGSSPNLVVQGHFN